MRKVSKFIGACALTAVAIVATAQVADLAPIMKQMNPALMSLRQDAQSNMANAAKDANNIQKMFKDAEGFFKAKKANDAVKWSQDAQKAAADAAKAAKANDAEGISKAAKTIQGTCTPCHNAHREGPLPDKTYRYKP